MTEIRLEWLMLADVKRRGKVYVARCLPLDVVSQGRTIARALHNLREAVELFVESCYERGVLEQVLKDAGFESMPASPVRSSARLPRGRHVITVPMSLVADAARHAG